MQQPLKILFVSNSLSKGGKERQICELIKGLSRDPDFKIALCLRENSIAYPINSIEKLSLFVPEQRLSFGKLLSFQYKVIRDFSPDVIHTWEGAVGFCASVLRTFYFRKKKIIDGCIRFSKRLPLFTVDHWELRINHFLADRVIANSNAGLASLTYAKGKKYQVIPNGFNFDRFLQYTSSPKSAESLRGVVMVASFSPAKDWVTFLDAALMILKKRTDLHFYCVGDGPDRNRMMNHIPDGMKQYFTFTGNVEKPEEYIQRCSIGVLLNRINHSEGMSNSIMEYMILGLPVICTRTGGNLEMIGDGRNGFLVGFDSLSDVREKMEKLIEDPGLCGSMGKLSREIALGRFSSETMVRKYSELYHSLVS